jgi:threonine dehydrogenase-like Zn-dependent dehydrogenase
LGEYGRAAVLREPGGRLDLTEYAVPEVEPGAALIRVSLANVCGSDLHIWRGELDPRKRSWALPKHMGHEMTGRIAALGEGVTTDSDGQPLAVGDRVVYRYFFPCGRCRNCLNDCSRACPRRYQQIASTSDEWPHFKGAFGDYFYLHPEHVMFKVPDALPDDLVVGLNCAFSQVVCGLEVANLKMGETLVIQGAGGLGLYAIAVARESSGAGKIIVIDGVQERLDLAAEFGADELLDLRELKEAEARITRVKELADGWGAEVVMDVAGFPSVVEEGVRMLAGGGRYIEIGNISPGLTYSADPSVWVTGNVNLHGIHVYEPRHLREALSLLERTRDRYPYDRVVSHRLPLDQVNEALAAQDSGHVTRTSLVP